MDTVSRGCGCDAAVDAAYWRGQAERLASENVALRAREAELEGQVAALSEKLATVSKLVFGDSSEKQKPNEPRSDGSAGGGGGGDAGGDTEGTGHTGRTGRRRGQQPGGAGHGRRDYTHLETEEQVHDVPEGERVCADCGAEYVRFGEETSEQVGWEVRLVRIVHRRRRYRKSCRCPTGRIVTAPAPPKPVPKGLFTTGFCARLLCEKYVLGRPLHKIAAALGQEGLDVAESTMVGVCKKLSVLVAPLDAAIRARNAAAAHLHIDETSWRVFEKVEGKANRRWWLWVFVGADTTVFRIERSRSTKVLTEHLGIDLDAGVLVPGRRLLVSSDFFTVYQALATVEGVDPLWCWAHIRRYFIRAGDAHREHLAGWAAAWTRRIGTLYVAHRARRAAEAGTPARAAAVEGFTTALNSIDLARRTEAADPHLHPAAAKVLATLDREWDGLARHEQFPAVDLDNNRAERALRNPVVGRKNYYGSGAVWSAELASRVWTITATAAAAGLNPLTYLRAYLHGCARAGGTPPAGTDLARYLPWAADAADRSAWSAAPAGPAP